MHFKTIKLPAFDSSRMPFVILLFVAKNYCHLILISSPVIYTLEATKWCKLVNPIYLYLFSNNLPNIMSDLPLFDIVFKA